MSPEENKALVRRFIEEVFNKGHVDLTFHEVAYNCSMSWVHRVVRVGVVSPRHDTEGA